MTVNLRQLAADREAASADKAELFDFYNKHWDSLIADIVESRKIIDDDAPECDECGSLIPDDTGGSLANKHHLDSCSLYDPNED